MVSIRWRHIVYGSFGTVEDVNLRAALDGSTVCIAFIHSAQCICSIKITISHYHSAVYNLLEANHS